MGQVVAIQSYRGGTGKSNLTANLACALADLGKRVAVLDADLASPGVHVLFNFDQTKMAASLPDFLHGRCDLEEVAYDVSAAAGSPPGSIHLLPSSMKVDAIMRLISEGYDVARLNARFADFIKALRLDWLLIDTHPGHNKETLLTTAIANTILVLIRPDAQDFHGTAVLLEIARRLKVPNIHLVLNKVLARSGLDAMADDVAKTFGHPVLTVLPLAEELIRLGSAGIFIRKHPEHAWSGGVREIARRLTTDLKQ